eukprot:gnl/MRDRNA2_/MRDRNA2_76041_c0_seq2.p1 gnl/MRDRNA2_/MRDRNA2_76041_c0~~gnl/MRDRNA2_/MRDRNA2_76041_c0_seq2.p1  ORF type:complete len:758 (-),score=113.17 gnl/MRDRNA2_/MRDRNA2_76041_c0_seq2:487-2760(-)
MHLYVFAWVLSAIPSCVGLAVEVVSGHFISTEDGKYLCTEKSSNGIMEAPTVSVCNASIGSEGKGARPQRWSWDGLQLKMDSGGQTPPYCLQYKFHEPIKLARCDPRTGTQEFCSSANGWMTQNVPQPYKFLSRVLDQPTGQEQSCGYASSDGFLKVAHSIQTCQMSATKWYVGGVEIQRSSLPPPPCNDMSVTMARVLFVGFLGSVVFTCCACCAILRRKKPSKPYCLPIWNFPIPQPSQNTTIVSSTRSAISGQMPTLPVPPGLPLADIRSSDSEPPVAAVVAGQEVIQGVQLLHSQKNEVYEETETVQVPSLGISAQSPQTQMQGQKPYQLKFFEDSVLPCQARQGTQLVTVTNGTPGTRVHLTAPDGSISASIDIPSGIAPGHSVSICVPTEVQPQQPLPVTLPAIDLMAKETQDKHSKLQAPPAISGMNVFGFRGHCPFIADGIGAQRWMQENIDTGDLNIHFDLLHPYAVYVAEDQSDVLQTRVNDAIEKARKNNPKSAKRMRFELRSGARSSASVDERQQPSTDTIPLPVLTNDELLIPPETAATAPRVCIYSFMPSLPASKSTTRTPSSTSCNRVHHITKSDSTPRSLINITKSDSTPRGTSPSSKDEVPTTSTCPSHVLPLHSSVTISDDGQSITEVNAEGSDDCDSTTSEAEAQIPTPPPEEIDPDYGIHPQALDQVQAELRRSSTPPPEEVDALYGIHPQARNHVQGSMQRSSIPTPEEMNASYASHLAMRPVIFLPPIPLSPSMP